MKTDRRLRLIPFAIAALTVIPGCRADPVVDEPAAPVAEAPRDPWTAPPLDSLYGATASENLRVQEVLLEARGIPRGWDGMRIALLSDLLIGRWRDNTRVAETAVGAAISADPDVIVIAGNILAEGGRPDQLRDVLRPLGQHRTFAVLGVRDVRTDSVATAVAAELRGIGITVLRNEAVGFVRGGETAFMVGIEPITGTASAPALADVLARVEEEGATPLLLSPIPEVITQVPEGRFSAILAGNVNCGEVEVPGTQRFAALAEGPLAGARVPRVNRLFHTRGSVMFVSCGTGYGFVPARWGAPPEVAIVTLHRIPERQLVAPDAPDA